MLKRKTAIDVREEWTAALTSGNYRQGRNFRYNVFTGKHCAIGVLEAVLGEKVKRYNWKYPAGLSISDAKMIMRLNDSGVPFECLVFIINRLPCCNL